MSTAASPATGTTQGRPVARWSWVLVLVVGVVLFELVRRALVSTQNPNLVPSLILLGALVAPATFVTFIRGRRLPYSVRGGVLALVALVGGVVGVVVAGTLEYDTLRQLGPAAILGVGLIEEGAKLLAPFALLVFGPYRRPGDGLLIGVASGAGFAALETMGYAFVTLVQSDGDLGIVDNVLLLRGVLSVPAHMAWTGLTAAALYRAGAEHWTGRATLRFAGVFVTAVVLHALWDGLGSIAGFLVIAVIGLGLLTVTAHRIARSSAEPAAATPGGPDGDSSQSRATSLT